MSNDETRNPALKQISGVELLWRPEHPAENIVGMTVFRDIVVFATTRGIYAIVPEGAGHWISGEGFIVQAISDKIIGK